jgi:hypothetical protein
MLDYDFQMVKTPQKGTEIRKWQDIFNTIKKDLLQAQPQLYFTGPEEG